MPISQEECQKMWAAIPPLTPQQAQTFLNAFSAVNVENAELVRQAREKPNGEDIQTCTFDTRAVWNEEVSALLKSLNLHWKAFEKVPELYTAGHPQGLSFSLSAVVRLALKTPLIEEPPARQR